MGTSDERTHDIFRECFSLHRKVPSNSNRYSSVEPGGTTLTDDDDADDMLLALTLFFNLGACHHRRGLAAMISTTTTPTPMSTTPPADLQTAKALYQCALQVLDPREPLLHGGTAAKQPSHSAYWLLILAVINNLGCLAFAEADHETVQVCLALGLHAMQSIDLPLSWNNQVAWCNPSPAA